jgi:hypothetical protein
MNRCSYVCDDPPARLFLSCPNGRFLLARPCPPRRDHLFVRISIWIINPAHRFKTNPSLIVRVEPDTAIGVARGHDPEGGGHVGSGYCACPGCRHWIRCDCGRAAAFGSFRPHRQGLRSAGEEQHDDPAIRHYLSELRRRQNGNDADGCLPIFLRVQELRGAAQAQGGRLLRFLLLRRCAVSPHSGGAFKRGWDQLLREQLIATRASLRRRVRAAAKRFSAGCAAGSPQSVELADGTAGRGHAPPTWGTCGPAFPAAFFARRRLGQ